MALEGLPSLLQVDKKAQRGPSRRWASALCIFMCEAQVDYSRISLDIARPYRLRSLHVFTTPRPLMLNMVVHNNPPVKLI